MWERAQYLIHLSKGESIEEISALFGRHAHTIRSWIKRYKEAGIEGLSSVLPPGRPNKKQALVINELETLLTSSPQQYGYLQAGWSIGMLLDYFQKKRATPMSDRTLSRALNQTGYVYKRFSKTMPVKAPSAEAKQSAVKQLVKGLRKEMKRGDVEIFFEDESHFSNEPSVERGWFKRGEKKGLPRLGSEKK